MNEAQNVHATRRIYRYKGAQRDICAVFGVLFATCGLAVAFLGVYLGADSATEILVCGILLLIPGVYMLALGFRSRLVIDGARIAVHGVFGEHAADLSDIDGFRTVSSLSGFSWQLILKDGRRVLAIPNSFNTDEEFRAWLQQIPDLDQRDNQALLLKVGEQEELGTKLQAWLRSLANARRRSLGLLVIALAAAVALNLATQFWLGTFAVILMLTPFIAAYLCWQSPSLYTVFKKKGDHQAETGRVLVVAVLGLLIRTRGFHFVSLEPLVVIMVISGVAIMLAYYHPARHGAKQGASIAVLFLAGLYAYSSAAVMDVFLDNQPPTRYSAEVVDQHVVNSHPAMYYLRLTPWGSIKTENEIRVPSRVYYATHTGDSVCFNVYPGRFMAPWFIMTPCLE